MSLSRHHDPLTEDNPRTLLWPIIIGDQAIVFFVPLWLYVAHHVQASICAPPIKPTPRGASSILIYFFFFFPFLTQICSVQIDVA